MSDNGRQEVVQHDKLPLEVVEAVAEALVARGLVKTLSSLNGTSKKIKRDTLPILWRTVIWKPKQETERERSERWKRIMIDAPGARHIQFIVDRETYVPNTTRELPRLIKTSTAFNKGTLKGYTARWNDEKKPGRPQNIQNNDPKVVTHLLPSYIPLSDDFVTLLHALYGIFEQGVQHAETYYPFIVHCPDGQLRYELPPSLDRHHRILPSMPYSLENVYILSDEDDFVDGDRQQLTGIVFDFLAALN